jgi:hypothetical protein
LKLVSTLHVALQEGFLNDRVVVKVNGAEIANRPDVSTRNQIGFAEAIEVEVPDGAAQVEVQVPTRGLAGTVGTYVEGKTYVGVSIEGDQVRLRQQREAFGYL